MSRADGNIAALHRHMQKVEATEATYQQLESEFRKGYMEEEVRDRALSLAEEITDRLYIGSPTRTELLNKLQLMAPCWVETLDEDRMHAQILEESTEIVEELLDRGWNETREVLASVVPEWWEHTKEKILEEAFDNEV